MKHILLATFLMLSVAIGFNTNLFAIETLGGQIAKNLYSIQSQQSSGGPFSF